MTAKEEGEGQGGRWRREMEAGDGGGRWRRERQRGKIKIYPCNLCFILLPNFACPFHQP